MTPDADPSSDDAPSAGPGRASLPSVVVPNVPTDRSVVPPMTPSLLGRWFAVPLVIVGTIVGGAVLVVLLFGGPAAPQQRSLESLLQALESSSGERSMGLLMPREKELWQVALELSLRLEKKDREKELTEADLQSIADRLASMVRVDLALVDKFLAAEADRSAQHDIRATRLEFLIRAMGRTERPEVVGPLLEVVRAGHEPFTAVAMTELGNLHRLPESRQAVAPIVAHLQRTERTETILVACTVLSVLGTRGDRSVVDALAAARLANDGEAAWSASLALARLGSSAGESTLMDLLDRAFLQAGDRYQVRDQAGTIRRYALPLQRVDEILLAAIDAARNLDEPEIWAMIAALQSDRSPAVRGRATAAMEARAASGSASGAASNH